MLSSCINNILRTIIVAGINQIVFNVKENNTILISGIDKDGSAVVFHRIPNNGTLEKSIGVHRVSVFLDRLKLFDLTKAVIEQKISSYFISSLTLKEGRKKISYTFAEPANINHPKEIVEDVIIHSIDITKEMLESLYKASQTLNSNEFFLYSDAQDIIFKVVDETSGIFFPTC